jgi:hypothetical protein
MSATGDTKEQGLPELPQNVTEDQRRAIQAFVHSAIVPLIEDVIVKKLGQAAIVLRDELAGGQAADKPRDREADRARFPDADFNRWLDEGISDCGHIVWHTVGDVADAWAAWDSRPHYALAALASDTGGRGVVGGWAEAGRELYEAEIEHDEADRERDKRSSLLAQKWTNPGYAKTEAERESIEAANKALHEAAGVASGRHNKAAYRRAIARERCAALRAQPAGGKSCGTCGAPVGERGEYAVQSEKAWAEGYRSGVDDERMSEANIGIAGFDAKVEPARVNPYRRTPPESGGQGDAVATVCLRGDTYGSGNFMELQVQVKPGTSLPIGTKLYTHPRPRSRP